MGYFTPAQKWGFPHKVSEVVRSFESGRISLPEALEKLGASFPVSMRSMRNGQNKEVTCIEFGCPVMASYIMEVE